MKKTSIGLSLFFILFVAAGVWRYSHRRGSASHSVERTRVLMDTLVRIEVFDEDEEKAQEAIGAAVSEIERLSMVFSHYLPDSEVSRLNREAGGSPETVSADLYTVLQRSVRFSRVTHGAFDITLGAVSQLWDFTGEEFRVPPAREIEARVESVDYERIIIDSEQRVALVDSGMAIDLNGVAKGYCVDRALKVLKSCGISSGLVDAGGDIGLLGSRSEEGPWRIGVRHPRDDQRLIAVIEVDSGSVATSGDYERFFIQDGRRYHHILDPKTGWPSRNCISVTILTQQAMEADILATGVFVLGPEKGLALVESLTGVEGLILFERDGRIEHLISEGLRERITFNR
ncbi:MAG: FAD:protein FMN transferase [bacterium]